MVTATDNLRARRDRILRSGMAWASHRTTLRRAVVSMPPTRRLVTRFVAGETLPEALDILERLHGEGIGSTVNVLGESMTSPDATREMASRYVETLDALAARNLDRNISVKPTQVGLGLDLPTCRANLERIGRCAVERGAFVRIDMEDHTTTDVTLDLVRELRRAGVDAGVVIQAYLHRSAADVDRLIADEMPVRLCKGAYDEPRSIAYRSRAEVDGSYLDLARRLLLGGSRLALATHDDRMIDGAIACAREHGIGADRFEFQMLYGVRRDLQAELVRDGYRVRAYVPYGTEWYPYFMRRLGERPANVMFLVRSMVRERRPRR